jgi:hypothetical protein
MESGDMEMINTKMTALADAVRLKAGITGTLSIDEMTNAVNTIEVGGGGDTSGEDMLLERDNTRFKSYTNNRVSKIGPYAFAACNYLEEINLPNCTQTGNNAFMRCTSLKKLNMPRLSAVASSAFYSCMYLPSIALSECLSVYNNAFYYCTSLSTVELQKCLYLSIYAF